MSARSGALIRGRNTSTASIEAAKIRNTDCQAIVPSRETATVGPTIWPAEPAAVAIARLIARCSGALARPTTARITPKPVPAMPNPTSTS